MAYALFDTLFSRDAFAREIKPLTLKWARELNGLCLDLRQRSITLVQWQEQVEKLLERIELKELLQLIAFDQLTTDFEFPDLGVNTKIVRLPKLEGLPEQPAFFSNSDHAFTFDMIMTNIDPNFGKAFDIENIDPAEAEKLSGNLLRVKKLSVDEALRKYGKEMHH